MNINYISTGDYFIPDFAIALETESLGKYGRMHHSYLQNDRPELYQQLLLSGGLRAHLQEIDQTCQARMEFLVRQMAESEGVDERLKSFDQLAWISQMNNIQHRAEEVILNELVYA